MPATIKPRASVSPHVIEPVETGVDTESPASGEVNQKRWREAWQRMIDGTLMNWLRDPSQVEDEGIDAPSGTILRLSMDLAERFRDKGFPSPDSVVPDPNGGIVFERREGDMSEVFHIWDDGSVEYMRFQGTHLMERSPIEATSRHS